MSNAPSTKKLGLRHYRFWIAVVWLSLLSFSPHKAAADQVLLRSWELIPDAQISSFDENGITLSDNRWLPLADVESAITLAGDQEELDRLITQIGLPLFRLKRRLELKDYESLQKLTQLLDESLSDQPGYSSMLNSLAKARYGLVAGERGTAAIALLDAAHSYQEMSQQDLSALQLESIGADWLSTPTTILPQFPPIWSDSDRELDVDWETLNSQVELLDSSRFPGVIGVLTSLAYWNGQKELAANWLSKLDASNPTQEQLRDILQLQSRIIAAGRIDRTEWKVKLEKFEPAHQALTLFWLAQEGLNSTNLAQKREALLFLLRIPAEHPGESELAAAALFDAYRSLEGLKQEAGRQNLARELKGNYPRSHYAKQLRALTTATK